MGCLTEPLAQWLEIVDAEVSQAARETAQWVEAAAAKADDLSNCPQVVPWPLHVPCGMCEPLSPPKNMLINAKTEK